MERTVWRSVRRAFRASARSFRCGAANRPRSTSASPRSRTMRTLAILLALIFVPLFAAAQELTPPQSQGVVIERIHHNFVVAPDFKITDVDGRTGNLAGVSAGVLQVDTLFIGGARDWLPHSPGEELA